MRPMHMVRGVLLAAATGLVLAASGCAPEKEAPAVAPADLERLQALGYVDEVPAGQGDEGVVVHDLARAFAGLHCFATRRGRQALVVDMEGRTVHAWEFPDSMRKVEHVELLDDGDLLAVQAVPGGLCRIGWDGEVRWCLDVQAHHDLDVDANGDLHLIVSEPRMVEVNGASYPILNDRVVRASPEGTILENAISLYDILGDRIAPERWRAISRFVAQHPEHRSSVEEARADAENNIINDSPYDVFHTNSIRVLDREVSGVCRPGDLLLSVRELDLVIVLDPKTREVRWEFGPGTVSRQHDATWLENDHLLLFDNGRTSRASRVIEVDPLTRQIVWSYDGLPEAGFYSTFRGGAQRLPNGNTLITDAGHGRVIEVTTDGEIVWTYLSPRNGESTREVLHNVGRIWGDRAGVLGARIAKDKTRP
jgi:hypothetical protein